MVKIRVDQDKVAAGVANLCDVLCKETAHFGAHHVVARISGDMDRQLGRKVRVLPPQIDVVLPPGKQVREVTDGYRGEASRKIDIGRQMHQGLLVPGDDFMPELAHDFEHFDAAKSHALREVDAPRERGDLEIQLPA